MEKERTIIVTIIDWQGIALSVSYEANWLSMERHMTAHLQIEAVSPERAKLPVTETGYRSHFVSDQDVEQAGGPVAYAVAWLDEAAKSPEWRKQQQSTRQLSLF